MALFNFKPLKKKKVVSKKNMSWTQAKAKYLKLSPFGDADRDGVKNWLDCKPFDKKRQDNGGDPVLRRMIEKQRSRWRREDEEKEFGKEFTDKIYSQARQDRLEAEEELDN